MASTEPKIILYDGVCRFCDRTVKFILPRDPAGKFRFATLQGERGTAILTHHGITWSGDPETIYLVEGEGPASRVFERSTAALRIARELSGGWPFLAVFLLVPRPIRDFFYDLFARNRYRWFGKNDSCPLPPPEWRARFLD